MKFANGAVVLRWYLSVMDRHTPRLSCVMNVKPKSTARIDIGGIKMERNRKDMLVKYMGSYLDEYLLFCDLCKSRHIVDDGEITSLWSSLVNWWDR